MKKIIVLFALCMAVVTAQASQALTCEDAVNIALKEVNGQLIEAELDMHYGNAVYKVDILKGNDLHTVKVNALNAAIAGKSSKPIRAERAATLATAKITHGDAVKIAQNRIPTGNVIESELEAKGGQPVYDLTIIDTTGISYEMYVNALNGEVISFKKDDVIVNTPKLSAMDAEKRALQSISGRPLYTKIDEDDGRTYYETKIFSEDGRLFEVKVSATTGEILKSKVIS